MSEYPTWLIDTGFVLPIAAFLFAAIGWVIDRHRSRVRDATEKATVAAELAARLDAQDVVLKGLSDGFARQFGSNGFVLHERQRSLEAEVSTIRDGLAAHVAQHVDRSFDR